jgi:hypothetical protein
MRGIIEQELDAQNAQANASERSGDSSPAACSPCPVCGRPTRIGNRLTDCGMGLCRELDKANDQAHRPAKAGERE